MSAERENRATERPVGRQDLHILDMKAGSTTRAHARTHNCVTGAHSLIHDALFVECEMGDDASSDTRAAPPVYVLYAP